jgi:hypothetical protein
MEWKPIDTAPFDHNVEIAVIDGKGEHALTQTRKQLRHILPTHWRNWSRLAEGPLELALHP